MSHLCIWPILDVSWPLILNEEVEGTDVATRAVRIFLVALRCRGALVCNTGLWLGGPVFSMHERTGVWPQSYGVMGVSAKDDERILDTVLSTVLHGIILHHCTEVVCRETFCGSASASLVNCHLSRKVTESMHIRCSGQYRFLDMRQIGNVTQFQPASKGTHPIRCHMHH